MQLITATDAITNSRRNQNLHLRSLIGYRTEGMQFTIAAGRLPAAPPIGGSTGFLNATTTCHSDMPTYKPLGSRLLVQLIKQPDFRGGIFIPPSVNRDEPQIYRVLAIGNKVRDIAVGNTILCYSYTSGPSDIDDGTGNKIINVDQVLAILPEGSKPA